SDAPEGFSDEDIAALSRIAQVASLSVEAETHDRIARTVLDTYVGQRTGQRILQGGIRRGFAETIRAVVWISDLRGFTALTETTARDNLLAVLDAHFESVVGAIEDAGGEVLKFLGDGVLAIFEVDEKRPSRDACRAALAAMKAARSGTASGLSWSLALDLGEVSYGNIGGATRLDFTVIGPAVNHAARLEALAGELGEPTLISRAFADSADARLRDLGTHMLRGVETPQQVFAPEA
ncbi:MAG: adenylate/guanylate cyclase domain-containing protein, partial [Alphaproteobacteria bacterium]|nr:adenylate/guanylate cyclase domain-containing protein [Alphaproteobacteria bacterium]